MQVSSSGRARASTSSRASPSDSGAFHRLLRVVADGHVVSVPVVVVATVRGDVIETERDEEKCQKKLRCVSGMRRDVGGGGFCIGSAAERQH